MVRIFLLFTFCGFFCIFAESKTIKNVSELEALAKAGDSDALCLLGLQEILGGELVDPRIIQTMNLEQIIQNKLPLFEKKIDNLKFADDQFAVKTGGKLQKAYVFFSKSAEQNNPFGLYLSGWLEIEGTGTGKNKEEGFKKIKKAADSGFARAQTDLGTLFWYGRGCEINRSEAFRYYQEAASKGDTRAMAQLGWLYKYGQGVGKNIERAVKYFDQSASQNDPYGLVYLGRCYLYGEGMEKNEFKGYELIKHASQGNGYGKTWLGICYLKGMGISKDEKRAFKLFQQATEEGDLYGLFMLGQAYGNGFGTPENDQKALEIYHKAAEHDSPEACWALGRNYYNGEGVPKDEKQASVFFEKGAFLGDFDSKWWTTDLTFLRELAEKNDSKAQQFLGSRLRDGIFTKQNFEEGNEWLEKALLNGDGTAAALLGECFEKATYGKPKNLRKAVEYYKKGEALGDPQCLFQLGYLSFKGEGMDKSEALAAVYYTKAAEKGHVMARFNLADLYRFGAGVEANQKKAFDLYTQVVNSSDVTEKTRNDARAKLGTYYLDGDVVTKDNLMAVDYFTKSLQGKNPSPLGMFFMGYCFYNGKGVDPDRKKGEELFQQAAKLAQPNAIQALKDIRSGRVVTVKGGS